MRELWHVRRVSSRVERDQLRVALPELVEVARLKRDACVCFIDRRCEPCSRCPIGLGEVLYDEVLSNGLELLARVPVLLLRTPLAQHMLKRVAEHRQRANLDPG